MRDVVYLVTLYPERLSSIASIDFMFNPANLKSMVKIYRIIALF